MTYQVSRNGQLYGPYSLEDLQRYVATGNVLLTDLAKSDDIPDWLPVSQVLAATGTPIPAPPVPAYLAPAYPTNYTAPAIPYPDPPNLPWALNLLFWFLTCSVFNKVYVLVQAAWVQKVQPSGKALLLYIIATVVTVINITVSYSMVIVMMSHPGTMPSSNPLNSIIGLAYIILVIAARFAMRSAIEAQYNGPEPIGLRLDPVMTFFFGGVYFQYHFNRINEIKRAMRLRGAAV